MALVYTNKPQPQSKYTDPTAGLIMSLEDFESILSESQQLIYRSTYEKPDARDVVAFVSRIDAENKSRARRCVAPRLCSFLGRAIHFISIVDTMVIQGPTISCLLWGSLKTAFLTASNVATYFDKVTHLIMRLGRDTPTFEHFGQLYASSTEVQVALCSYYSIVVNLCKKIVTVANRSGLIQTFLPIFNSFENEFKSVVDDLDQACRFLKTQINLASQQMAKFERNENSVHRLIVQNFQREARQDASERRLTKEVRQLAALKSTLLEMLSIFDHVAIWRHIKMQLLPGTAEWFQKSDAYQAWRKAKGTSILLFSGKLGSGKSILTSNIVSRLLTEKEATSTVTFFFCRSEMPETLSAQCILGSICRQLLETFVDKLIQADVDQLLRQMEDIPIEKRIELVIPRLEGSVTRYIVIDGLDECELGDIKLIRQVLYMFKNNNPGHFKIICSLRSGLENNLFSSFEPDFKLSVNEESTKNDVALYVRATLDQKLESGELQVGDPTLILEIEEVLKQGTSGMFLWTRFALEEICEQENDENIRDTMSNIPKELSQLIQKKLDRVRQKQTASTGIKVLQFCGVVRRPLTLYEMRELTALEIGHKSFNHAGLINNVWRLVDACCGLVHVEEEFETIQFVHNSVKLHLFREDTNADDDFDEKSQDKRLGMLCLTYLNFVQFDQRTSVRSKDADKSLNIFKLGVSTVFAKRHSTAIARYLLNRTSDDKGLNMQQLTNDLHDQIRPDTYLEQAYAEQVYEEFKFLLYAGKNWIYHCKDETTFSSSPLFRRCIESHSKALQPWTNFRGFVPEVLSQQPLAWLVVNDVRSIFHHLQPQQSNSNIHAALFDAFVYGNQRLIRLILESRTLGSPSFAALSWFLTAAQNRDYVLGMQSMISAIANFPSKDQLEYIKFAIWHSFMIDNLQVILMLLQAADENKLRLPFNIRNVMLRHAITTRRHELVSQLVLSMEDLKILNDIEAFDHMYLIEPTREDIQKWRSFREIEDTLYSDRRRRDLITYQYHEQRTQFDRSSDDLVNYHALADICNSVGFERIMTKLQPTAKGLSRGMKQERPIELSPFYYALDHENIEAFDILLTEGKARLTRNDDKLPYTYLPGSQLVKVALSKANSQLLERVLSQVWGGFFELRGTYQRHILYIAMAGLSSSFLRRLIRYDNSYVRGSEMAPLLFDDVNIGKDAPLMHFFHKPALLNYLNLRMSSLQFDTERILKIATSKEDLSSIEGILDFWKDAGHTQTPKMTRYLAEFQARKDSTLRVTSP